MILVLTSYQLEGTEKVQMYYYVRYGITVLYKGRSHLLGYT